MSLSNLKFIRDKKRRSTQRRTVRLAIELLEDRRVPSVAPLTIALDPANDEYGAQIETVTQFGNANRVVAGILDTGASPIIIGPDDQAAFGDPQGKLDPVPVKVPGGASGSGIGGSVTGDVSQPITVLTDGMHAAAYDMNFALTATFGPDSAIINGVQAFIGTAAGSPGVPTISGTPIFDGSFNSSATDKLAAKVDLIKGVDTTGFGILEPDVHFVPSTSKLTPPANEELATIPLAPFGDNNVAAPNKDISSSFNFVSSGVQLNNTSNNQVYSLLGQKFLLDTGSQISVISTAEATLLHIDLSKPFDSINVQGVGGAQAVKGYIINSLDVRLAGRLPLTFTNVPVFVLDAAPGQIDGILGMNLWNNVDQMLINPHAQVAGQNIPTLTIAWDPTYVGSSGTGGPFGFRVNELLGHRAQASTTLTHLLGGAARSFKVPAQSQLSAPQVPSAPAAANIAQSVGAASTSSPTSVTVETVIPALEATSTALPDVTASRDNTLAAARLTTVSVTVAAPAVAPQQTVAIRSAAATAPTAAPFTVTAPPFAIVIDSVSTLLGAAPGTADATEIVVSAHERPTVVRLASFQSDEMNVDSIDAIKPNHGPFKPGNMEAVTDEAVVSPGEMNLGPSDAALVVALSLVIRDYWLPTHVARGAAESLHALRARFGSPRPRHGVP